MKSKKSQEFDNWKAAARIFLGVLGLAALQSCAVYGGSSGAERSAWNRYKLRIVNTRLDRLESCASPPMSKQIDGDTTTLRYGFVEDGDGDGQVTYNDDALMWCALTVKAYNGVVQSYETEYGNPGGLGLRSGEQTCAHIVDACYGQGRLAYDRDAYTGTRVPIPNESEFKRIATWRPGPNTFVADMTALTATAMANNRAASIPVVVSAPTSAAGPDTSLQPAAQPLPKPSPNASEIDELRRQLEEQKRLNAEQQRALNQSGSAQARAAPAPSRPPQPQPRASYLHSSGYESDGSHGLIFNAYVENNGDVALQCDTRVTALVWETGSGNRSLQTSYSDRRTTVVYPGRKQVAAGITRVVANSGNYEMSCKVIR